jgi:lipoprotein-anchoring transpeptidase ErfK/SrfK
MVVAVLAVAPGCGSKPKPAASATASPASAAVVKITPANKSRKAKPDAGITVTVADGTLVSVKVKAAASTGDVLGDPPSPVEGTMASGHTRWWSRWALHPATTYTVTATAVDPKGLTAVRKSTFRTLTPRATFSASIFQAYGATYGVGMPIMIDFSSSIADSDRWTVERSLELYTSKPVVGAWYWDNSRTLYFRPRDYWPAHTKVSFTGHLDGIQASSGVYGVHTLRQSWIIGRSLIVVAGTQTHRCLVYLEKRLFGNWPMSSGRPGKETPNGSYVSMEKRNPQHMVGPDYDLMVPWSVRFTWGGDFLHAASWSVGQQGLVNVSHGCVNLSPQHAETYYKMSVPGDPVTITGSPKAGRWDNGWTVWFLSWHELLDGSATGMAVRTNDEGSRFVDPSSLSPSHARPPLGTPAAGNALPD